MYCERNGLWGLFPPWQEKNMKGTVAAFSVYSFRNPAAEHLRRAVISWNGSFLYKWTLNMNYLLRKEFH